MVGAGAHDIWGEAEGVRLVQPEEGTASLGPNSIFQYLCGGYQGDGARLVDVVHGRGSRDNGQKWKRGRF